MADIDLRILRVSIEIDGEFQVYQDLDITASGKKTVNNLQNDCTVTIVNLTKEHRNYLLTETSPFNKNKTPKRLIVEAGRVSEGVTRLFYGEITSANPSQPPDIGLVLKAQTGSFAKGKIVARSGAAQQSLRTLAGQVAGDLGAALDFQATDRQVANYSFTGAALRQVDQLGALGGLDAYMDDQTLVVKDRGVPLANRIRLVNKSSGMIGIPEVTEKGVKVEYLLDTTTALGGTLEVQSELNPACNGRYSIYGLDFEVSSRREPFYYRAEASRI